MTPDDLASIKAAAAVLGVPIYWPNQAINAPEPPAPYVWAEITGLAETLAGIGSPGANTWRDDGFIRFHIVVPANSGVTAAYTLAKQISDLYRGQRLGNVQCMGATPLAGTDNGAWWVASFSIPFWTHFEG